MWCGWGELATRSWWDGLVGGRGWAVTRGETESDLLKVKPIFADRLDEGHKQREESRMTPRCVS